MASYQTTISSLFIYTLLSFLLLSNLIHATSAKHGIRLSHFRFLELLKGCHKGDQMKGIQDLKKYLEQFGYLQYSHGNNLTHANDDYFDDLLEAAIRTYQTNYNIKATGTLDAKTISKMTMPRCGVPDIVNGTTRMRSGKKSHSHLHTISHSSLFRGMPKNPRSKFHLTYGFLQETQVEARTAVARAFQTWAANTHFTFSKAQDYETADIKIGFARGDHGDGYGFDGPGGTLAHAFQQTDGRFYYDGDETWAVGAIPGAFDLETVALHEIGHLLGLGHSSDERAIMYSSIIPGATKGLNGDDIQGIKALHNVN